MSRLPRALATASALLLTLACGHKAEPERAPAPAVRSTLVQGASAAALELRGVVASDSRLRLGFKMSGILATLRVKEGDRVRRGQLLAELDPSDAQAQLNAARATLEKAKRDAARAERLAGEGALPTSARDDAKSQLDIAEAQYRIASEALGRTRLAAPVDGTVFQRLAEPGESLGAAAPVVVLDETSSLVVKVGVTERDLKRLAPGQPARLQPEDGSPAVAAKVASLAPTPNPADGLYEVELKPDQRPAGWVAGALVQVRFEGAKADPVLRVPLDAVVHRRDQDWVFTLEGEAVRLRQVQLGRSEGREVAVKAGLKGGERIVTEGAYFLQDGQAVRKID